MNDDYIKAEVEAARAAGASLKGLLAFARTKPAGETYSFTNSARCAAGQYLRSIGSAEPELYSESLKILGWLDAVNGGGTSDIKPRGNTWGALVQRIENILRDRQENQARADDAVDS